MPTTPTETVQKILKRAEEQFCSNAGSTPELTDDVLDSLISHIAVLNADGVIVKVNESWRRFAQENDDPAERENYLGENYLTICGANGTPDEEANAAFIGIGAVLRGEKNFFSMEYQCHSPFAQRWFLMTVAGLRDSQGVVVSHTDITESRRVAEAMRRNQSMMARTESIAHIGSWEWEVATDTVTWSDELFRIVGMDSADGAPTFAQHHRIYHPDDMAELKRVVGIALNEGTPYEMELRAIRPDGETRVCLARGFAERTAEGSTTRLFGSLQDITESKRAEESLRAVYLQLELMTAAVPGVVYQFMHTASGEWKFIYVSKGIQYLYEVAPEEALLDHNALTNCILPKDMIAHRESVENASRDLSLWVHEHRILTPSGKLKWVRGQAIPQRNGDGSVLWNGILIDISERKQAEEELRLAKIAAESANRAKSEFLANMSHEIRNPMNGVLGMTQLLEMTELTEKQQEYVAALELSGHNLLRLINDILDLSKIEAGKISFESAEFSLRQCINDIALMQKPAIHEKRLHLHLNVSEEVPHYMTGDQHWVKQILHNLIGNAVKFTSRGSITISARLLEQRDSSVLVQIAVRDSGIGIEPQNLDKIFKPFEQEDGSTTRTYGGTGLGLTISRRLTELMGGSISVESTIHVGSCFQVTLPFAVVKERAVTLASPQQNALGWDGPPLRILLVEDDQVNITFETLLLQTMGHDVIVAKNGGECLAALENGEFDLVLMDINMPDMNGEEALREIRGNEQDTTHQMVIALTAYALRGDKERFLKEGFDGYVSKPIVITDLMLEMKRVLGVVTP